MAVRDSTGVIPPEKGALYRLDAARGNKIDRVEDKVSISNGLAWDLKEKAFYYCDTPEAKVRAYDYDVETGQICKYLYNNNELLHSFSFSFISYTRTMYIRTPNTHRSRAVSKLTY